MSIAERHRVGARALVLAPHGRDAAVAMLLLEEIALPGLVCEGPIGLLRALDDDTCFVVATEEALIEADLRQIEQRLAGQPSWSDVPFIVLTHRGGNGSVKPAMASLFESLGNVTLLERPFRAATFVSAARSARKGRERQYQARGSIAALHESEARLRRLNETLEERVAERTAALERAHAEVLAEMGQRERAEAQLLQAQKMETIGQLTGGIAHDFNNLLMAILGNMDMLQKHVRGNPAASRLIDSALTGARRGATLTQRLLAFARRQSLQVTPRDMIELVDGMRELVRHSAGSAVEVRFILPDTVSPALMDANQVELALLNLVVNARDAMPRGGVLTVEVDEADADGTGDLVGDSYVRLSVSDTGHGMDAATLARATEPFFSTKELGKGTGLGLSTIHGLARQLDGALLLSSEPGRGTRAELWLPVTGEAAVHTEPPGNAVTRTGDVRRRILVVDDDALVAMSTVDMLEDLGHEVMQATSGQRALEILRDGAPLDLLITDYMMPRMTGAQLAVAARELRPDLPILLATGFAEVPQGAELDLPRIGKPYLQDQLATEIAKLLD